jgi:Uma2 family endonuclease
MKFTAEAALLQSIARRRIAPGLETNREAVMQMLTTSPLVKTYTLEEFWELPEPTDGTKLELIAGVLYMSPMPGFKHHFAVSRLLMLLAWHQDTVRDRGMILVPRAALWTSTNTFIEPDFFYLSAKTFKQTDWTRPDYADLVVEVTSPGSVIYDRNTKADTYAALGVPELWLVDPDLKTVEVKRLSRSTGRYDAGEVFKRAEPVRSKVLPKFAPAANEIFKR